MSHDSVPQAVNIGEVLDSWVPEELSEEEKVGGRWWRQLLAGGGAGAGESPSLPPSSLPPFLYHSIFSVQCQGHVQLLLTDSRYSSRYYTAFSLKIVRGGLNVVPFGRKSLLVQKVVLFEDPLLAQK